MPKIIHTERKGMHDVARKKVQDAKRNQSTETVDTPQSENTLKRKRFCDVIKDMHISSTQKKVLIEIGTKFEEKNNLKDEKKKSTSKFFRFGKLIGPGLVTGASDDDPSGIATYSQAGAKFGFATLWTAIAAFPLMAGIQEMCARIGLVTSVPAVKLAMIH